ncbi:serpin-ZX isoform X2 [Medicago truncatula]|uniref:serpin-ZX isoform X2 n=1 Tax=Medicago truncatula TaxID=3880 RepID=UPI000D2F2A5C|nr:serpin-ZX isoform X2 [Medicago truncatula]
MEFRRESMITQTNVSLKIAKHLFSKQPNNNIVFSPLSIQVILSIIAAGSEGSTQQQLLDFLRFKSIHQLNSVISRLVSVILKDAAPSGGPCLSVANGVWVEQTLSLQTSFQKIVSSDFQAKLASVDFQNKAVEVTNEVNSWVEKETNGLIKGVIQPGSVNSLTRLIFANALYFKGLWYQKFDASKTKDYDFHLLNGSSLKVPFMSSKEDQYIGAFDGFKVLCLHYKQGQYDRRFSIYFILPDAKDGLSALVEKVASESELLHRPRSGFTFLSRRFD